jgi:hypothetical protein
MTAADLYLEALREAAGLSKPKPSARPTRVKPKRLHGGCLLFNLGGQKRRAPNRTTA